MTERECLIAVAQLPGIGPARSRAIADYFGSIAEAPGHDAASFAQIKGMPAALAEKLAAFNWQAAYEEEILLAEKHQTKVITCMDADYPQILLDTPNPPICLYIRGKLDLVPERCVAIIGSRNISAYAHDVALQIAGDAVNAGFTVVSGLALGADTAAHWGAVRNNGPTVGVIGGGMLNIYPADSRELAEKMISSGGAVISEFPMNAPVSRENFPRRNRIVAGLCCGVIVIEAAEKSGAMITVEHAVKFGRALFALPGHVTNEQARGCHALIRSGKARLIETFADVMEDLGAAPAYVQQELIGMESPAADDEHPLLAKIRPGGSTIEELAADTGTPVGILLNDLMLLELQQKITCSNHRYLLK